MTDLRIDRGTTWRRLFRFTDAEGVIQPVEAASFEFTIPKKDPVSVAMTVFDDENWELVLTPDTTRRLALDVQSTYTIMVDGSPLASGLINPQGGNNYDGN